MSQVYTGGRYNPDVWVSHPQPQPQPRHNKRTRAVAAAAAPVASHEGIHDVSYYRNCLAGGILSSSIRWVLTPLDAMKCNMQVYPTKYPNFTAGLQVVYQQQGFRGLYRGLIPTILSYSSQTGTKYMMYEWGKDHLTQLAGEENAVAYKSLIYVVSAGCAEAVADILMCPWETLKIQLQTSPSTHPPRLGPAMTSLFQRPDVLAESLGPLWGRQIAGTMANFFTFEHSANAIYQYGLGGHKSDYTTSTQLAVTFCAGYISGLVSTLVSHPADTIISLKAKYPDKSVQELIQQVGWRNLATQGLGPRIALTGSIIGFQWFVYDTFKTTMGMGTSGGN